MTTFRRFAIAAFALAVLCSSASAGVSSARAICSVRFSPGTMEGLGKAGGLIISTRQTYEDCGNSSTPLLVYTLCSATPTNSNCTTDARFHYTESALLAVLAALVDARHNLDAVDIFFEGSAATTRAQQVRIGLD